MRIKAKKSLGQNFLINKGILEKIVTAAQIDKDDIVVEVGPGTGNLTEKIEPLAQTVLAIEKDHRLVDLLRDKFAHAPNVRIIAGDILKFNPEDYDLKSKSYKLVANLPYYITSYFLRTILEKWPTPRLMILTIQKEVAQRIMAKPPEMNLLAILVQLHADSEIISYVSAGSFRPIPKVDSAIIKIVLKDLGAEDRVENARLLEFIKIGFGSKRKKLLGLLADKLAKDRGQIENILAKLKIDPNIRAENLTIEQWKDLKANF